VQNFIAFCGVIFMAAGKSKFHNECGAGLIEYALLAALIAVVALPSVTVAGLAVADRMCDSAVKVVDANINAHQDQRGFFDLSQRECCTTQHFGFITVTFCGDEITG
jgi:Flp pilus assembly pilin Flp